jgi:hypothetical protein
MTLRSITSRLRWSTKCILLLSAAAGALSAASACAPLPPGITAWFTFEEPLFQGRRTAGIVGSALRLNGRDEYVEVPASNRGVNVGDDDFTIEMWVRSRDIAGTPSIVDKRDHRPVGYLVFLYRGRPGLQLVDRGKPDNALATSSAADGQWHHLAGVVQRLPPRHPVVYVDGVRQRHETLENATLSNLDVPVPLWLGRHHGNRFVDREDIYFRGDLDELTFYDRALKATEIQSIFRAGRLGKCRP